MQFAPSVIDAFALQIGFLHFHFSKSKEQNRKRRKKRKRGEKTLTLTLIGATEKRPWLAVNTRRSRMPFYRGLCKTLTLIGMWNDRPAQRFWGGGFKLGRGSRVGQYITSREKEGRPLEELLQPPHHGHKAHNCIREEKFLKWHSLIDL